MGTGQGHNYGDTAGKRRPRSLQVHLHEQIIEWARDKTRKLTGRAKNSFNTACVVYDTTTGKYYYGRNGGYLAKDYVRNPKLFGDSKHRGILPKKSLNIYPVGNCAEVDAVNKALNDKARLSNLHMITIHTTKSKFGQYKPACENCTRAFKGRIRKNYSGWHQKED